MFTGMSVLSVFEIVFWLARFIFKGRNVNGEPIDDSRGKRLEKKIRQQKRLKKRTRYFGKVAPGMHTSKTT